MSIATMVRREARARGLAPLTWDVIPATVRPALSAWTRELRLACAHVERGEFGIATMPNPQIVCPLHLGMIDTEADPVACSKCGADVTGEPGTIAGYLAPAPTLWLLVAFCRTCASGGGR